MVPLPRPILVLTTEPLPVPGGATTGAGLRAWGLAKGLAAAGLPVVVACPGADGVRADFPGDAGEPGDVDNPGETGARPSSTAPPPGHVAARTFLRYHPDALPRLVAGVDPSCVVLQHWGLASELPPLAVPLAIDLAGPHLLERLYWGDPEPDRSLLDKLAALRRADFVVCSGERQRLYFLPYLAQAGHDLTAPDLLPVIPFSIPDIPEFAPHKAAAAGEPTFVYGGTFLAWQDPTGPIGWLLDELNRAGRGRLLFYGAPHPIAAHAAGPGNRFADLLARLRAHPRVEVRGTRPYDRLLEEYRTEGTVALDLMARNPERELAYTTRTVVYLACGLPVIHDDYSELSDVIRAHGAGWTLPSDGESAFRGVVRDILSGAAPLATLRAGARAAAMAHRAEETIAPLAAWCHAPVPRPGRERAALGHELLLRETRRARDDRDTALARVATLEGRMVHRLHQRLPGWAAALAPLARWAAFPLATWVHHRLKGSSRPARP